MIPNKVFRKINERESYFRSIDLGSLICFSMKLKRLNFPAHHILTGLCLTDEWSIQKEREEQDIKCECSG